MTLNEKALTAVAKLLGDWLDLGYSQRTQIAREVIMAYRDSLSEQDFLASEEEQKPLTPAPGDRKSSPSEPPKTRSQVAESMAADRNDKLEALLRELVEAASAAEYIPYTLNNALTAARSYLNDSLTDTKHHPPAKEEK